MGLADREAQCPAGAWHIRRPEGHSWAISTAQSKAEGPTRALGLPVQSVTTTPGGGGFLCGRGPVLWGCGGGRDTLCDRQDSPSPFGGACGGLRRSRRVSAPALAGPRPLPRHDGPCASPSHALVQGLQGSAPSPPVPPSLTTPPPSAIPPSPVLNAASMPHRPRHPPPSPSGPPLGRAGGGGGAQAMEEELPPPQKRGGGGQGPGAYQRQPPRPPSAEDIYPTEEALSRSAPPPLWGPAVRLT